MKVHEGYLVVVLLLLQVQTAQPSSCALLAHPMAPIIRSILMSNAKTHADGHQQRKGLVRGVLEYINNVMHGLKFHEWTHAWEQVAGVAWISRLSRDTEANVRASALAVVASVASDPTAISLSILLKVKAKQIHSSTMIYLFFGYISSGLSRTHGNAKKNSMKHKSDRPLIALSNLTAGILLSFTNDWKQST